MRIISRPTLLGFARRSTHDARPDLDAWWAIASRADWKAPADVRLTFADADTPSGRASSWSSSSICRNDYRLIVSADFERAILFVYGVYTHADYDRLDLPAIAERLKAEQVPRPAASPREAHKTDEAAPQEKGEAAGPEPLTLPTEEESSMPATAAITVPADMAGYAALIAEFPLRPLRDAAEHGRALAVARSLMGGGLDAGEADYLEILVRLIEEYEAKVAPMGQPTDAAMLRFLLESRGVTQAALARATGIAESAISEVLSGKKALRRHHIGEIVRYFHVSPAVFSFDRPTETGDARK